MAYSPVFHFKRKPVYALPTWGGLALFFLIGFSLWFSILHRAPIEQWISFLMILLTLLHLLDANDPFRFISVEVLRFDPPFAGRASTVPVLITNPGNFPSEKLHLRFQDKGQWIEVTELAPQSSIEVHLNLYALSKGKQTLPRIRLKMRPKSGLFQLWRVMDSDTALYVLPEPTDHGIAWNAESDLGENADVSSIELIRDPRFLPKLDQKLFLKTGLPYMRTSDAGELHEEVSLEWERLHGLSKNQQEEQFSNWIQRIQPYRSQFGFSVRINTPFFKVNRHASEVNWSDLKIEFSEWVDRNA